MTDVQIPDYLSEYCDLTFRPIRFVCVVAAKLKKKMKGILSVRVTSANLSAATQRYYVVIGVEGNTDKDVDLFSFSLREEENFVKVLAAAAGTEAVVCRNLEELQKEIENIFDSSATRENNLFSFGRMSP